MRCVTIRRAVLGTRLYIGEKVVSNAHWLVRKDSIIDIAGACLEKDFASVEAASGAFHSVAFDAKGNGPIAHGPDDIKPLTAEQFDAVLGEIEKRPRERLENTGLRLRVPTLADTWTADVYRNVEGPLYFATVRSEYADMVDDGEILHGVKFKEPRPDEVIEAFFDHVGADWNWCCMAVRGPLGEFERNVLATAKEIGARMERDEDS